MGPYSSYTSNTLPQVTKKYPISPTINDEVNQVSLDDILIGKKTKNFKAFRASPLEVDEEINPGPGQVATFLRKGAKIDLLGSPLSGEFPELALKVGSDLSTRSILIK